MRLGCSRAQAKTTKKITLKMTCSACKAVRLKPIKRAKHFEICDKKPKAKGQMHRSASHMCPPARLPPEGGGRAASRRPWAPAVAWGPWPAGHKAECGCHGPAAAPAPILPADHPSPRFASQVLGVLPCYSVACGSKRKSTVISHLSLVLLLLSSFFSCPPWQTLALEVVAHTTSSSLSPSTSMIHLGRMRMRTLETPPHSQP